MNIYEKIAQLSPFQIVDVNEYLPYAKKFHSYNGNFKDIVIATNGEGDFDETIQQNLIVTFSEVSVFFAAASGGATRAVIETDSARDIFKIELTSDNAKIFPKPTDIFSYNHFFVNNCLSRLGMFFPVRTTFKAKITRTQKAAAVNGDSISATLCINGFEI